MRLQLQSKGRPKARRMVRAAPEDLRVEAITRHLLLLTIVLIAETRELLTVWLASTVGLPPALWTLRRLNAATATVVWVAERIVRSADK